MKLFQKMRSAKRRARSPVPTSPCLFTRLGVNRDASPRAIANAYAKAKALPGLDAERLRLLADAYQILSHSQKREIYQYIHQGMARGLNDQADPPKRRSILRRMLSVFR